MTVDRVGPVDRLDAFIDGPSFNCSSTRRRAAVSFSAVSPVFFTM